MNEGDKYITTGMAPDSEMYHGLLVTIRKNTDGILSSVICESTDEGFLRRVDAQAAIRSEYPDVLTLSELIEKQAGGN